MRVRRLASRFSGFVSLLCLFGSSCTDDPTAPPTGGDGVAGAAGQGGNSQAAGTAGAAGDSTGSTDSLNRCKEADYVDRSAPDADRTVRGTDALRYDPACLQIAKGQTVTFRLNVSVHPTRAGKVTGTAGGTLEPSANNPIPPLNSQTTQGGAGGSSGGEKKIDVSFSNEGLFPYYCDEHQPTMAGVVRVK